MGFTSATRNIKVSHWGSIDVHEHFNARHYGTKISGEFHHSLFDMHNNGIFPCKENFESKYPWFINDLYFHDYIGNITTSHALRTATEVEAQLHPRFPVCGGWTSDWDQGYSVPSKYYLS